MNKSLQQISFDMAAPIYIALSFFRFYVVGPAFEIFIAAVFIAIGLFLIAAVASRTSLSAISIFVFLFLVIMSLFIASLDKNNTLTSLLQFLANLGFAWAILNANLKPNLLLGAFSLLILFFIFNILSGVNPDFIFSVSRNYISVLLILSVGLYYFACQANEIQPNLLVSLSTLVILLWAIGRAGILSGVIIFSGTILLSGKRIGLRILLIIVLGGTFLFFQLDGLDALEQFYVGLDRFERLSTESQRVLINAEYLSRIFTHFSEFLFGAPLDKINAINEVNGNPHNSYISLHTIFGGIGVIFFIWAVMITFRILRKARQSFILLIFVVALFRSLFDSTAFYGPMDVLIFYSIFFAFSNIGQKNHRVPIGGT